MPRYHRLFLPHMPLHIVQRGHDCQPVFIERTDYEYYLANLREKKNELSIRVYAYCLMTNHVHLLIEPGARIETVSQLLRVLAGRQTRHINKLEKRTGTLWEGRFKASLVDSEAYLLACYRYIDLNPVRAAMMGAPDDYEWSSYRHHVLPSKNNWLDQSDVYQALGATDMARSMSYRAFVSEGIEERELATIRTAVRRNQVTGTTRFKEKLAERIGRRIPSRGRGRPRIRE